MSISTLYIPLFTIEEVILNKDTGLPLSGGVVKFFRDSQRVTPKDVFQIAGSSPNYTFTNIGNELTLSISGTFVDGSGNPIVPYAYPYDANGDLDLYYVTVESSGGVSQFTRQAVPYVVSSGSSTTTSNTENELCNPQFVEVFVPSGQTIITVSGANTVTPIAPGWDFVSSGSGTITVERLEPTSTNIPTNPPYALQITASSGLGSTITLRQRLNNTPSLLRGGFISGTLTAAVISGGTSSLNMIYAPSTGSTTTIIPSTSIATDGAYHTISANATIPQQVNTAASTGYVDINITIPTSRTIAITSIQAVGTAASANIPFDQQTSDRQKDHLFHAYESPILLQPKNTLLSGWLFPLNPWQFGTTASSNIADNRYVADQTILVQQNYVSSATGNNVAVGRGALADNFNLQVTAVTANNQFALLQYIDPATIRPYWGIYTLACLVRAKITTSHSSSIKVKVRLIYKAGLPNTVSQTDPVATWTANQDPVAAAGYTLLSPTNDPAYTLTSSYQNFSYIGFQLPTSTNSSMTLGILVYTIDDMDETATADVISFEDIALTRNDHAMPTFCMTFDEAVRRCQYYYEYSWNLGSAVGLVTDVSAATAQTASAGDGIPGLRTPFKVIKRANPSITWYSPTTGAANNVRSITVGADYGVAATLNAGGASTGFPQIAGLTQDADTIYAHWVADSRMGT